MELKKLFLFLAIFIACIGLLGIIVAMNGGGEDGLLPLSIAYFTVSSLFIASVFLTDKVQEEKIKKHKEEQKEQKKQEEERINHLNQQAKEGKWQFPAEKFFKLCEKENVKDLDNSFSLEKAKLLAERCINETTPELTKDNYAGYLTEDSIKAAWREGLLLVAEAEQKEIERKKQIKDVSPNETEGRFLKRAKELAILRGSAKRVRMLENMSNDYMRRVREITEAEQAMKQLGMLYLEQQQKTSDWAVLGGIAEGIAGPAAGVAVAMNTMANNQKIQQQNAAYRNTAMSIMSGIPNLKGDKASLMDEVYKLSALMEGCKSKVVLSTPSSDEVWRHFTIGKTKVERRESGVLAVSVPVQLKNSFDLNLPDGVEVVIDGTIAGEVWCNKEFVADIYFPLPIYGLPINMCGEYTLDGMCARSAEYEMKYTVKLKDKQNLWLIER